MADGSTFLNSKFIGYQYGIIHIIKFVIINKNMVLLKFHTENISSKKMINMRYYVRNKWIDDKSDVLKIK